MSIEGIDLLAPEHVRVLDAGGMEAEVALHATEFGFVRDDLEPFP